MSTLTLSTMITTEDIWTNPPQPEYNNAKTAWDWYTKHYNESVDKPTCSLMARQWIYDYREYHNITYEQFPCAVPTNAHDDWIYC